MPAAAIHQLTFKMPSCFPSFLAILARYVLPFPRGVVLFTKTARARCTGIGQYRSVIDQPGFEIRIPVGSCDQSVVDHQSLEIDRSSTGNHDDAARSVGNHSVGKSDRATVIIANRTVVGY